MSGGVLIAALKFTEYRFLVVEHSLEIYGGLVAVIFAVVGIRLGQRIAGRWDVVVVTERLPADGPFVRNQAKLDALGITPRELEISFGATPDLVDDLPVACCPARIMQRV